MALQGWATSPPLGRVRARNRLRRLSRPKQAVDPPPENVFPVGGSHGGRFLRRWADLARLDHFCHFF
jgi:hypothetical protein